MTLDNKEARASKCGVRIRNFGIQLPGERISLSDLELPEDLRRRLAPTGQEFTYQSEGSSTDLAIAAARSALEKSDLPPDRIGLVISAPTLLTAYGFEIPAVAIRAELGLEMAECLNVSQGCVGALAAMRVAALFLRANPERGDVLIVTACRASSLVDRFTHGAFSWGDGAAAAIVTADPGSGLSVEYYAEKSATADWGAMRIRYGDAFDYSTYDPSTDLRISVDFSDSEAQLNYIVGEKDRCAALIDALTAAANISAEDVSAVFLPSFGRKRVPLLLEDHRNLIDHVASDFRYAHMGGVDVFLFLDKFLSETPPASKSWFLAMSPAFTAQWAGLMLSYDPTGA